MKNDEKAFLKRWMGGWIIGVIAVIILAPIIGVAFDFNNYWKGGVVSAVLIIILIRWAIYYWYNNFEDHGIEGEKRKNPYRRMFFGSVNIISLLLLLIGLLGAFFLIFSSDGKNHAFEALGLVITIIWAVIFLRYFIWAIYHYNINFGLTDNDWQKILQAREDQANGLDVHKDQLKAPKYNPYRSQTFGLPPGTVRGMIAFTLLFGAISMLVVSMGMDGSISQDSFFWDHFEFYKTAFLMMIAFYFGDRSLKYLQKRWPSVQQAKLKDAQSKASGGAEPDDDIAEDDAEFASTNVSTEDSVTSPPKFSPTSLKKILASSENIDVEEEIDNKHLETEFIQIKDSETVKTLTDDAIASVARDNDLEPAVLKSIIKIESAGSGFLSDGRPKILFEGHKFWYWLKERKKKPENYLTGNENILYSSWTRKHYLGGTREYERFQKAYNIDPVAAIYSTSWGLFQILGENFNPKWGYCKSRMNKATPIPEGFLGHHYEPIDKQPRDFIEKQGITEVNHLLDFLAFVKNKKVKYTAADGSKFNGMLIEAIDNSHNKNQQFNWEAFAYGYNGSGFKKNNYDTKLAKAYEKYSNA